MAGNGMERALKLAAVTGMRCALGPALVAQSRRHPQRHNLAMAALGELIFDKLPLVPGRDSLLPMLARGAAGAWVAQQVMEEDGGEPNPWAVPLGEAVAMGVAAAAPKIRRTLGWTTGMPQFVLGMIEDYLALRVGTEAVGMSMDDVTGVARGVVEDARALLPEGMPSMPQMPWSGSGSGSGQPQSAGAGSM